MKMSLYKIKKRVWRNVPGRKPIIFCELLDDVKEEIDAYVEDLRRSAPNIGKHGLSEDDFWSSGLFHSAVEKLRGTQAATTEKKRCFVSGILDYMLSKGAISAWDFSGAGERHDYEIKLPNGRLCIIEAKGCLDGNNTNIFERPPNADEFIVWSLCQNPGSDPRRNSWSGIHTRLSAEIIHRKQKIDGLIIWDMLCGTKGRPCPKTKDNQNRATNINSQKFPPPCIYLFPRTIPDPRNNPNPPCWTIDEVGFMSALTQCFNADSPDIVEVRIQARMRQSDVERQTAYYRDGIKFSESKWTKIKRAR